MNGYSNFSLASYMFAYYAARVTDEELRQGMETYLRNVPLKKVYVENHRATTDVPVQRLREIRSIIESYGVQVSGEIADAVAESEAAPDTSKYTEAIEAAKSTAAEIQFEYEADRCCILYGAGLYGTGADDYRLMFIFRDGSSQTVYQGKVTAIRVNAAGSVLYYNITAPDGREIQHGVNFD